MKNNYNMPSYTAGRTYTFKPLSELDLADNFMFVKVMTDPDILKEFLQIILHIKIKNITFSEYEKSIFADHSAKSIRMDIYADDDSGKKYCVEMQAAVEYNIAKRSRYYQSVIDIDSLSKGDTYDKLKDTYVIFICMFDPFQMGMQKYVFEKRCVNAADELALNDGICTIILADNKGEPVIDEFFNYLKNSTNEQAAKSSSKLVKLLNDKVNNVRLNTSLEVEYLKFEQLQREQYERGRQIGIEEGIEYGIEHGKTQIIKNMIAMNIPENDICAITDCDADFIEQVRASAE